jgi:hypothetical protein
LVYDPDREGVRPVRNEQHVDVNFGMVHKILLPDFSSLS